MGRPRLVDVAARAGVSRTAASAALGGSGRISERTRQHVIAAAIEMGYEVNATARNLRTQRAGAVGLHLPGEVSGHEYYMQFAFGVVQRAPQADVPVVLIFSGDSDRSLGRERIQPGPVQRVVPVDIHEVSNPGPRGQGSAPTLRGVDPRQ